MLSSMVGAAERGESWFRSWKPVSPKVRGAAARLKNRPKVYFEEWDER